MFADFQQSVLLVAGDGILTISVSVLAGAILLAILDVAVGVFRRNLG